MGQPAVGVRLEIKRIQNFDEVSKGLSKKMAVEQAKRCLHRSNSVSKEGCPLGVDVLSFVRFLCDGNSVEALEKILEQNCLPGICGRLCSAPCEMALSINEEDAPIGIRRLERFASDSGRSRFWKKKSVVSAGRKIAVVGSGPAGLTAAAMLAMKGYQVSILDAFDQMGGVLRYGMPVFRLPFKVLDEEIQEIQARGVEFRANCYVGKTVSLEDLQQEGFEVILLATGAGKPDFQNLPGVNGGGVYYAQEFLLDMNSATRIGSHGNSSKIQEWSLRLGKRVVVLGSEYMSLDCARIAARLGKNVVWVSSKPIEDKKILREESAYALGEGVVIESLVTPLEILSNEQHFVKGVKCQRLDYADAQSTGQWELTLVPDSEFVLDADSVIIAMGHKPNSLIQRDVRQLKINDDGTIWTDPHSGMTSVKGVFACGDVVTKSGLLIEAMVSGKKAAGEIDRYLSLCMSV